MKKEDRQHSSLAFLACSDRLPIPGFHLETTPIHQLAGEWSFDTHHSNLAFYILC